jgi:hypothetical protein
MKRLFLHAARKASPLVGEVGGGRPASAGQENFLSAKQSADADRSAPPPNPPHKGEGCKPLISLLPLLTLAACAAQQQSDAVAAGAPGFWLGLWHGFIFPVAWIVSLFVPDVAIYAVPNSGGWYDFGYFVGIVFLGVGARKTRTVYQDRVINVRARRID